MPLPVTGTLKNTKQLRSIVLFSLPICVTLVQFLERSPCNGIRLYYISLVQSRLSIREYPIQRDFSLVYSGIFASEVIRTLTHNYTLNAFPFYHNWIP